MNKKYIQKLKKVVIKMLCSSKNHLFIEDIFLEQGDFILPLILSGI